MKGCPLKYQRHGPPREVSPEDGKRLYLNEGLVFAIFGMEMCGTVVSKVHSNHNPKESSYLRHFLVPFYPLRTRRVRSRIFWLVLGMPPRRKKINEAIKPKFLTGSDGILLIRQEIIQSSISNYWQQGEQRIGLGLQRSRLWHLLKAWGGVFRFQPIG